MIDQSSLVDLIEWAALVGLNRLSVRYFGHLVSQSLQYVTLFAWSVSESDQSNWLISQLVSPIGLDVQIKVGLQKMQNLDKKVQKISM